MVMQCHHKVCFMRVIENHHFTDQVYCRTIVDQTEIHGVEPRHGTKQVKQSAQLVRAAALHWQVWASQLFQTTNQI